MFYELKYAMRATAVSASACRAVNKLETAGTTERRKVANALSEDVRVCDILKLSL